MEKKAIFVFADSFDATTATRRTLMASKTLFSEIEFLYWSRQGNVSIPNDEIYKSIRSTAFNKTAAPRSIRVFILFCQFQFWVLFKLIKSKPKFIIAFTFYTILPTLIYRFCFNWKCKVVYDPRDYVAVSYRINKYISKLINIIDNVFIKLSDLVIFPDNQYFIYYGKFKLHKSKYFILPNSTEDCYNKIIDIDIYLKYQLPKDKLFIPIIGYFSETRGKYLLYEIIKQNPINYHFIVAGELREKKDIEFFTSKSNVSYIGKIPYIDALSIMQQSIFVPQLYDPSLLNNKYAFPTKYYDCLMVGTPVVASVGQISFWENVKQHNSGYGIKYNDVDAFNLILEQNMLGENFVKKEELRKIFLEKYDFNLFVNELKAKYQALIN